MYGIFYTLYIVLGIVFFDPEKNILIPATLTLILFLILVVSSLWIQRYHKDNTQYLKSINIFYFLIVYACILSIGFKATRYEFVYLGLLSVMLFSSFLYIKPLVNSIIILLILGSGVWMLLQTDVEIIHIITLLIIALTSLYGSYTHYSHLTKHRSDESLIIEMNEMLNHLTNKDILTNLYNNTFINDQLHFELERAKRYQTPLCLLMLDIDNFIRINKAYGQVTGDDVLSTVGNILSKVCRSTDMIGRFSGEEFIVILPNTSIDEAIIIGERVRLTVEHNDFNIDEKITVSLGLSEYINHSVHELIEACQLNIQVSKSEGQNKISY